jgi:CheY-like chemotaxis protein
MPPSPEQALSKLAHDLRNPLSALISAARLLEIEPKNAAQVRELAAMMSRQLGEMRRLIDRLSELSGSAQASDGPEAVPHSVTSRKEGEPLPTRRILVVDDNPAAAQLLQRLLEKLGQEVVVLQSAEAAIDELPRVNPHIVISDITMPGMSGYELAKKLRALDLQNRPRLIALSGYGAESDRQRALAAGFDDYLVKPAGVEMLRVMLESPP